jgi:hypothetical protein
MNSKTTRPTTDAGSSTGRTAVISSILPAGEEREEPWLVAVS